MIMIMQVETIKIIIIIIIGASAYDATQFWLTDELHSKVTGPRVQGRPRSM
jgi:hypothetical protein